MERALTEKETKQEFLVEPTKHNSLSDLSLEKQFNLDQINKQTPSLSKRLQFQNSLMHFLQEYKAGCKIKDCV